MCLCRDSEDVEQTIDEVVDNIFTREDWGLGEIHIHVIYIKISLSFCLWL